MMMKLTTAASLYLVAISITSAYTFGWNPYATSLLRTRRASACNRVEITRTSTTSTQLAGWFDFKPVHGGGSGNNDNALDEQWQAQQDLLNERRGHISKEHLKKKYAGGAVTKFDTEAMHADKYINIKAKEDAAMHFASSTSVPATPKKEKKTVATASASKPKNKSSAGFKLPWEK
jgi:hypothetical protein